MTPIRIVLDVRRPRGVGSPAAVSVTGVVADGRSSLPQTGQDGAHGASPSDPQDEAVTILRQLIRIDTTNTGDPDTTVGSRGGRVCESLLTEVGYSPRTLHDHGRIATGRPLADPGSRSRPGLCSHGHLDVVPAVAEEWSVPPFEAAEIDGMIWGRGAVDMKDMDAMIIALIRDWARTGFVPPRDIVVIFTPDEEAGCWQGSHWIVDNRPELLEGVSEAVGEVGGFSLTVRNDLRLYLLQTARRASRG